MFQMINSIVWAIASAFLLSSSIYFSIKLKFLQFRFPTMLKSLFSKEKSKISPFQTLMMVLAARIGVGSLAGVALAIYIGGVGTIFWMWVIAFFSAINCYAESVLGVTYQEKDGDVYKGGPSYYMKNGLGYKRLGGIYASLVILSYIGGFIGIQSNTIVKSFQEVQSIPSVFIGGVLVLLSALIIFGGVKKIAEATSKIVPFMTIIFLGLSIVVLFGNMSQIPRILSDVLKEAFALKPFFSGFIPMVLIGMQRGLFSSEAGLGTGSIASSVASVKKPSKQGYIQMIGVYVTVLLICSATAIIILTSPYQELNLVDLNGIEITSFAFSYHFGTLGNWFVMISILFFAFSTILTGYYYVESSVKYFMKKDNPKIIILFKILTLVIVLWGSLTSSNIIWNLIDFFVALLAIVNTYALMKLRKVVIEESKEL